jgi:NADPH:quinone reductase-like Zn-dependent oxidoreductase
MRAAVYRKYGPPSVLHLDELETPSPGPTEILLRVAATEVTKSDCELRKMRFPVSWLSIPLRLVFGWFRPRRPVLGAYLAGTVVSLGDRVTRFEVGDEVYGSTGFQFGGYGEYVNVSEDAVLAPKPSNLSPSQAASIPLGGLNAIHFMRHAKIRTGERMLILGAGGSIRVNGVNVA